jgi:U3 small nucleolar RNA-associated protein 13
MGSDNQEVQIHFSFTFRSLFVHFRSLFVHFSFTSFTFSFTFHFRLFFGFSLIQSRQAELKGHLSAVQSLVLCDGILLSGGRDKVLIGWDLARGSQTTFPLHHTIEAMQLISQHPGTLRVAAVGDDGINVWDLNVAGKRATCIWGKSTGKSKDRDQDRDHFSSLKSQGSLYLARMNDLLIQITETLQLVCWKIDRENSSLHMNKQIVGHTDTIIDAKFIPHSRDVVVAVNSEEIRVYNRDTLGVSMLHGHTDIVMSIAVSKNGEWIASSSKDNTVRLWRRTNTEQRYVMYGVGTGHTQAVGAVAVANFIVTAAADRTLKKWEIPDSPVDQLVAVNTTIAHEKDVNAVAISPNDGLYATASQDKTIKLWDASSLTPVGVLRGHRRGVWVVEFSPIDKALLSASGDNTIRIWSVTSFVCLKTFEGHAASVLRASFITAGTQVVSAGADGLIKLWTVKSNECIQTIEAHEDKVWALSVSPEEDCLVSGSADSTIHFWFDKTEEHAAEMIAQQDNRIALEQDMHNHLRNVNSRLLRLLT